MKGQTMHSSIANKIIQRIRAKKRGWVFTPKHFLDLGTRSNVDFVLHQLVHKQMIRRVCRGIYDFPLTHPKLGILSPSTDNILQAVMAKTGEVIQPSGAEAANWLGLSTQVPTQLTYLTSGRSRTVTIGNALIRLKHTSVKPLRGQPDMVSLVVQALLYMGKQHIDQTILGICAKKLSSQQKNDLRLMAAQTPGWLTPMIHNIAA